MIDPSSSNPIVILRDEEGQLFLPIWIGLSEANAIQLKLEGKELKRPMTHDLLRTAIETLDTSVERVVISDLKEHTFFAIIHLLRDGEPIQLDARPSDAIALALRTESPIFVLRAVLDKAQAIDLTATSDDEKLKKWFEELSPDDLGKYTM